MPSSELQAALNGQIGHEFAASQQYIALGAWYHGQTLPQAAEFFYRQAVEERNHAMMLLQYLLDTNSRLQLGEVAAPRHRFGRITEPVELALEQERRVSEQICELVRIAREDDDFTSEQFLQWFLKEQVEEVASMSALLDVALRAAERPEDFEAYLARRAIESEDPTAPAAAGGAL
jgi:ferritin